ncbi:MAG: hypothetical protein PHV79_01990 [Clostridia bacterium]|nr:hypothetical protein [Clostridia bacterium]
MNKQFMLRVYDSNALKKIDELYKKQQKNFKSFNEFLSLVVLKGVDKVNAELGYNKEKDLQELVVEIKELKEQISSLKKQVSNVNTYQVVNGELSKAMLGCLYEMIFALNENQSLNTEYIENGFYDKLPFRYSELYQELYNAHK